jgi:HEAT repeat protein
MRVIAILLLLFLLPIGMLSTQEANQRPLTIEELFLSQDIEVQIIRNQALAGDRESKLLALQTIRSMINSGSAQANEAAVIAVLDSLAGEGVYRVVRQGGAVVNNFPEVRRQAANLLGQLGGEAAKTVLVKILSDDPEPMVLSEAVFAIGRVGINEPQTIVRVVDVLRRNTFRVSPDNNLAFATLLALEQLSNTGNGIARADVIQALIEVVSGNYIEVVRAKALDLLSNLRR